MHPKVLAQYKKFNAELPNLKTANAENLEIFHSKTKASGKPIRREIVKVVRVKEKAKEYFYYGQSLTSEDALGNEIHVYMQPIGSYELPEFSFIVDPHTDARIPNGIKNKKMVYELKWPGDFTKELEQDIADKVDLLVMTPSRIYGGFTWDDFKNRTFEELVTLGKYGILNPSPKIVEIADQRTRRSR